MNSSRFLCLLLSLCAAPAYSHYGKDKFSIVYQWRFLEYAYDTPQLKQNDLNTGNLIPRKPAPIDVDVYYDRSSGVRKIFVTSPRFQDGVPAALGTVVVDKNRMPYVKPYPSWEWFKEPRKCKTNRIVSVYRIMIDECDRLWVLDNGQLDAGVICPPQVLAFDLKTNQLIHRYEIPRANYEDQSTFVTPIVEVRSRENQCRDTFLYLADCSAFTLIVYDVAKGRSWKIKNMNMYPDPNFGTYNIAGESFDLMDGILGMGLSPYHPREGRKLFYHAMSSDTEHWVYTKDLQNETKAGDSSILHNYKGRRGTQSAAEAIDAQGIMYFGLMNEVNLACFNTLGEYGRNCSSTDIVANNHETLQFISGIKVINAPNGQQEVWIVSSRFQKVATDNIKNSEFNFRIQVASVRDLKLGTRCAQQYPVPGGPGSVPGSGPIVFPESRKKK